MTEEERKIALIDLDGSCADYDKVMREEMEKLRSPNEPAYTDRLSNGLEPAYIEARRKLIQARDGFWRNLPKIEAGFEIINMLRKHNFALHVLTKGPTTTPTAWREKLEWSQINIPDAFVNLVQIKSMMYGHLLFDDWPAYYYPWLEHRPRGYVIAVAQPWNKPSFTHKRLVRYDGSKGSKDEVAEVIQFVAAR